MPAHQLRGALDGVPDVEQAADQRLDPAQRPPLIGGEPVRQRPFPQFQLEPGPLLRAQPLPRHRAPGPQRLSPASLPGPVPPPHRPFSDPQVARDLIDLIAAGEPPGGLHPQLLTPLLLGGRVPAPLRVPHTPVIRPKPAHVTTLGSTSSVWLGDVLRMRPGKADRGICTSCHGMPSRALPPATAQLDDEWMIAGSLGCGDSGVVSMAIQGPAAAPPGSPPSGRRRGLGTGPAFARLAGPTAGAGVPGWPGRGGLRLAGLGVVHRLAGCAWRTARVKITRNSAAFCPAPGVGGGSFGCGESGVTSSVRHTRSGIEARTSLCRSPSAAANSPSVRHSPGCSGGRHRRSRSLRTTECSISRSSASKLAGARMPVGRDRAEKEPYGTVVS